MGLEQTTGARSRPRPERQRGCAGCAPVSGWSTSRASRQDFHTERTYVRFPLATPKTSSGFIALRAATLGVHDLVRRDLRAWLNTAVDFRGDIIEPAPPEDETLRVFAGAIA